MAGAEFIRVDLHVHTVPDAGQAITNTVSVAGYVTTAIDRGLGVLAITDHNETRNVRDAVEAASGTSLLVLPGIEISTHEGHLLALFAPDSIAELEAFSLPANLQLAPVSGAGDQRSSRSMLDLVGEIADRRGMAIPAHVDAENGLVTRMASTAVGDLLRHPGLAGLEFSTREALQTWFTEDDTDDVRRTAWQGRQQVDALRDRGLARIMSSDAHSIEKLGEDRSKRTLTRLKLDHANFDAVRNAVIFNPKARCKAEAVLPLSYPRVQRAAFTGGFLDGVTLDFSSNLTCIIGGRGSGKSTALLAIRAALGAPIPDAEDSDAPDRMPDSTLVTFTDNAGSERTARRDRGGTPIDVASGSPIHLPLSDLGQGESGVLARDYAGDSTRLLDFLDSFVDLAAGSQADAECLVLLGDNASEILRTNVSADELAVAEKKHGELEASLKAAQTGKVEELAKWAELLASQTPLLTALESVITALGSAGQTPPAVDIDALALEYGVDLSKQPAVDVVEGADGLRARLVALHMQHQTLRTATQNDLTLATEPAKASLQQWKDSHADLKRRRDARQAELEAQGLKVQAGAIRDLAERLRTTKARIVELRTKKKEQEAALSARKKLLAGLWSGRESVYERRRATLKRIAGSANSVSDGLRINISFEQGGMRTPWVQWLASNLPFRTPRVQRLASLIPPSEFAEILFARPSDLLSLKDEDGSPFFTQAVLDEALPKIRTWPQIFDLETMRLDDRPRIEIQEAGSAARRPFDHLSEGQQRSVLLSLLLCAERTEPLVLDQPEDHLDAQYIARSVVRHLEMAKERRQIILATHSPNLTVLGDAELVLPMHADGRRGAPRDVGAVDRPETRMQVCALLEGGEDAFARRGQRYGFDVRKPA